MLYRYFSSLSDNFRVLLSQISCCHAKLSKFCKTTYYPNYLALYNATNSYLWVCKEDIFAQKNVSAYIQCLNARSSSSRGCAPFLFMGMTKHFDIPWFPYLCYIIVVLYMIQITQIDSI